MLEKTFRAIFNRFQQSTYRLIEKPLILSRNQRFQGQIQDPSAKEIFTRLNFKDQAHLRHYGVIPKEIKTIPVEHLLFENNLKTQSLSFFEKENGTRDRSLPHLHTYAVLKDYIEKGEEYVVAHLEEYSFFRYNEFLFRQLRMSPRNLQLWTNRRVLIEGRLRRLIQTYEHIRSQGYLSPPFENSWIIVRPDPHEDTADKWEILSGHHRATVLHVLGIKDCLALVTRPISPA